MGKSPTEADLHELSAKIYPRFWELLRADAVQLEDTLRRAVELPALRPPLTPGEFALFSSVALGILLENPDDDLEAMRPGLASWLRRNIERFRAEGLLEDRRVPQFRTLG